jgi:DNA polymerase-3 subunit beta
MKAIIQTQDLHAALGAACSIIKGDESIRITFERAGETTESAAEDGVGAGVPGLIRILAFNDLVVRETRHPAVVSQTGSIAVSGEALRKFVSASVKSDASLTLETSGSDSGRSLRVETSRGAHEFDLVSGAVFEAVSAGAAPGEMMSLRNFASALSTAVIAAATPAEASGAKAVLIGVHIRKRGEIIDVVGTNAKRMSLAKLRVIDVDAVDLDEAPDGATIPTSAVSIISKMIADGPARIKFTATSVVVEAEDGTLAARLIDAPYPDYARLLGMKAQHTIEIDSNSIVTAMSRCSASIGADARFVAAQLARDGAGIHLTSRTSGQSSSEMISEDAGGEVAIGFDIRYMTAAMKAISAKKAEIEFTDADSPIFIRSADRPDLTMLVMPCRV